MEDSGLPFGQRSLTHRVVEQVRQERDFTRNQVRFMVELDRLDPEGPRPSYVPYETWKQYVEASHTPVFGEDGRRTNQWKAQIRALHERGYGGGPPLRMIEPTPELVESDEEFERGWRVRMSEAARSMSLDVDPMTMWQNVRSDYERAKAAREEIKDRHLRSFEEGMSSGHRNIG